MVRGFEMAYMCWFKDWEKGFFGIEIDRGGEKRKKQKEKGKKREDKRKEILSKGGLEVKGEREMKLR